MPHIPPNQAELGQVGVAERETGEPNRGLGSRRRVAGGRPNLGRVDRISGDLWWYRVAEPTVSGGAG